MITIVDYGMGNFGAVLNMLRHIGARTQVSGDAGTILRARKLLLPGVGAFDAAMLRITDTPGLRAALDARAGDGRTPILGICLGMQLVTEGSEEGRSPGLGWIRGRAFHFPPDPAGLLKVPHMGWNTVAATPYAGSHPLWACMPAEPRFYFVHRYYVRATNRTTVLATAHHGQEFDAVLAQGSIFAAQFHPERSHRFGMQLLKNFAAI